jgi:hypothetical protein
MSYILIFLVAIVLIFGVVVFRGSPYVQSHKSQVKQAFYELYKMEKSDLLVDIGSGDGLILRQAASTGARAVGFEINPILVLISRLISRKYGNIQIRFADFWLSKLPPETTVVYAFSVTRDIRRVILKIQDHSNQYNKPIYIISYGNELKGLKLLKNVGAHFLYLVEPLQSDKAQV